MPFTRTRSISLPIVISVVTVLLTVALLVMWTLVIVQNMTLTRAVASNTGLLVFGIVSFAVIMSVLVMFSVFLVREILEVRRQHTFIDSVTHELKSPLASIKLCLDTLARPQLSDSQRDALRDMMLSDVDRLSVFIDDILQASRIAHGQRSQTWTLVDIPALVERCIDIVRKRYHLSEKAISTDVPPHLTMHTDPTALEIVLKNLLDNAVKYSPEPVHVAVSIRSLADNRLELLVRDHGIGIAKPELKRIFRRFYRVADPDVHTRRGTGLGLFVVAALVRNLGGKIEAYSEGLQCGASIRVLLPLVQASEGAA